MNLRFLSQVAIHIDLSPLYDSNFHKPNIFVSILVASIQVIFNLPQLS